MISLLKRYGIFLYDMMIVSIGTGFVSASFSDFASVLSIYESGVIN